jgi:hypothetical protein
MDRETLGEKDIIPHRGEVMMGGGGDNLRRQVVENNVSTDFDHPPSSKGTRYPDEVSFGILGITKEATGFTTRCKFGEGVG